MSLRHPQHRRILQHSLPASHRTPRLHGHAQLLALLTLVAAANLGSDQHLVALCIRPLHAKSHAELVVVAGG